MSRSEKLLSKGWTEEGSRLLKEARAKGMCAQCGRQLRSKYPIGDARRLRFCWNKGQYPNRCSDIFYHAHYQSWNATRYAVHARVRAANGGEIRCEECGQPPKEVKKVRMIRMGSVSYDMGYYHPGYELDHVVELAAGGDALDVGNVRLLCLRCHRRKTARFARSRRHRSPYVRVDVSLDEWMRGPKA